MKLFPSLTPEPITDISGRPSQSVLSRIGLGLFGSFGVLPILVVVALVTFTSMSAHFLTTHNLVNVLRQSVFLTIVSLGQMIVLLTGGFDLSVGTIVALTSVFGAMVMASAGKSMPNMIAADIAVGAAAGMAGGSPHRNRQWHWRGYEQASRPLS